jgi:uncharacterized protein YbaP (TraB family)
MTRDSVTLALMLQERATMVDPMITRTRPPGKSGRRSLGSRSRGQVGKTLAAALLAVSFAISLAPTSAAGNNFLWKASKGRGTIYLVGSVHLLTKDYYPLNPALDSAYKDSDLLVEEIDLGEMMATENQMNMLTKGMLPAGQTLDKVVSPATFALVNTRLEGLGLPVEPLTRLKPWLLSLTLLGLEWQKAGFEAELGLDQHFYERAKSDAKTVQALETIAFQLSRFDEMTLDEQDRLLAETLKELDTQQSEVTKLADAWKAGDAPLVERLVLQDLKSEPKLYQRMLVDRNRDWLPKLEALFARRGRALVVVGAAHLVGSDGLLAMLRARGYTIEQL